MGPGSTEFITQNFPLTSFLTILPTKFIFYHLPTKLINFFFLVSPPWDGVTRGGTPPPPPPLDATVCGYHMVSCNVCLSCLNCFRTGWRAVTRHREWKTWKWQHVHCSDMEFCIKV